MRTSYGQMYRFYLLGIQPRRMDSILNFIEKYSIVKGEKAFRSITGAIVLNIKFEKVKNGSNIDEALCFIQDESFFR